MADPCSGSRGSVLSGAVKHLVQFHVPTIQRQDTRSYLEVPLVFRENNITTGYRIPGKPWTYYLRSFVHLDNETFNIWSHCAALLIFLYKVYQLWTSVGFVDDPLAWPILTFASGIISYAALSTFAHLFHSKSPLAHYTFFQIDYIGIGMNGFGTGCLLYFLTGSRDYYAWISPVIFMSINTILSVLSCMTCSMAKLWYSRPYPPQRRIWQFAAVGAHVTFGTIPLICCTKHCLLDDPDCTVHHLLPHFHAFFWFFLSVYFFGSGMPEKLAPGKFDFIGNGHQLFHVLITVTSLLQLDAGLTEMKRRTRDLVTMAPPDDLLLLGSTLTVLFTDALFIALTHQIRVEKVANDELSKQKLQ